MQNPVYANGKTDVELVNGNYVVTARFTTDKTKGEIVSRTVYNRHAAWMLMSALSDALFADQETASVSDFPSSPADQAAVPPRPRGRGKSRTKTQHKD